MRMDCLRGATPRVAELRFENGRRAVTAALVAALLCAGGARAQQVPPPAAQFDSTGFIAAATLDGSLCPDLDPMLRGGTVTVNGLVMIVPCNTILQMPASALAWSQLFPVIDEIDQILGSYAAPMGSSPVGLNGRFESQGPHQTGLALSDSPGPYPSFEIRVVGNVVKDASGNDQYIAGLIAPISQQALNLGSGKINCIDYQNGFLYVGGNPARGCILPDGGPNGIRVQINDPIGRWGLAHSPDPRFAADLNNTTIHASSGFPMCVPRVDPAAGDDPFCPSGNRPLNGDARYPVDRFLALGEPLKTFDMPRPADGVFPDARQQAPFVVGDLIHYSGTLAKDAFDDPYISAHTIQADVGIFTAPGIPPAYVSVEQVLLGSGGTAASGIAQEATTRIFLVGFTTDPTTMIDINAVDVDPCTGQETLRLLGTVDPLTQPVRGRFRFHVLGGQFLPPTRDLIVQSHTGQTPASFPFDPIFSDFPVEFANGLGSGQYRVPTLDFVFPENLVLGNPNVPANFQDLPFLAQGSGPLGGFGPVVGQLMPWPGTTAPAPVNCPPAPGFAPAAGLTSRQQVGDNFATANLTAIPPPDTLRVTAVWRPPLGGLRKVGSKGGQLTLRIVESIADPNIRVSVVGFGDAFVSPTRGRPYYLFRANRVPAPASVTVRSSLGAEVTVPVVLR